MLKIPLSSVYLFRVLISNIDLSSLGATLSVRLPLYLLISLFFSINLSVKPPKSD